MDHPHVSPEPSGAEDELREGGSLLAAGDAAGAEACFRRAVQIDPGLAEGHYQLGNAKRDQSLFADAIECYDEAVRLDPDLAEAHLELGQIYFDSFFSSMFGVASNAEKAEHHLNEALRANPGMARARDLLSEILERQNRLDDARACMEGATEEEYRSRPVLAVTKAKVLRRDGRYAEALDLLARFEAPLREAGVAAGAAFALQADLLDRLGRYDEAFDCLVRSKQVAARVYAERGLNKEVAIKDIQTTAQRFTAERVAAWTRPAAAPSKLVFLVGFPRSGTTLLDTILRSHPGVDVIEEKPMLRMVRDRLADKDAADPWFLDRLDAEQLADLRSKYFGGLRLFRDPSRDEALVVDKFPLNMVYAGLIHRVFPDAKFILALRDPRDCILSAFKQNFTPNEAMANFLTLADAAAFYDQAMKAWTHYRALLPLKVHEIRYEDIVADFTGTIRPLLDFLGLPWDPAVSRYQETAVRRGMIDTPSYHQVVEPIYRRAMGRWVNYRSHMAGALPVLQPWVEAFGYAAVAPEGAVSTSA